MIPRESEVQAVLETGKIIINSGLVSGTWGNISVRFSQRLLKFRKESSHINHNPLKIIKFMPYFTTKRRTSSLQLMKYDAVHHFRGCIHRAERKPAWKPLVPP